MRLLLAGATGLVGREVLQLALDDARVTDVVAPTRRALPPARGLLNPVVEFGDLTGDEGWWACDAVVCALGTTMRQAGSRAAFRAVDHDYPLAIARAARAHGARAYALNSALGAAARSRVFYSRVKGEVEDALRALGFASLTLVRPGLLDGERAESRPGERAALVASRALRPLLPKRWRPVPAAHVAQALLDAAVAAPPGVHVIESEALV